MKKIIVTFMIALMLMCSNKSYAASKLPFTDVKETSWYYDDLCTLYDAKVIAGFSDGTFKGTAELMKDQVLKMVVTTVNPDGNYQDAGRATVGDDGIYYKVKSNWFTPYLKACIAMSIIDGNDLDEKKYNISISREDVAEIIYRSYMLGKAFDANDMINDKAELQKRLQAKYKDVANISESRLKAVFILNENDIMRGDTDGNFNPKATLTRAEATALVSRLKRVRAKLQNERKILNSNIPGYIETIYQGQDLSYEELEELKQELKNKEEKELEESEGGMEISISHADYYSLSDEDRQKLRDYMEQDGVKLNVE